MNQRGELTSAQIIGIVLAIVGFGILLIFLTQLGTEDYSEDEICRLSVLSRATAAEILPGAQQSLPLQCTTKKVCLTVGDGECSQFIGEDDVVEVELPKVDSQEGIEQQAIAIERVMAQSMYDCWNIMGQGKLDLFSNIEDSALPNLFEQKQSSCVICSRVALSNGIKSDVLNRVNVAEYMEKNTVPGSSLTYLQVMTNGATNTYPSADKLDIAETEDVKIRGTDRNETAFIFMQIKPVGFSDLVKRQAQIVGFAGVTGAAGAFVMNPASIMRAGRLVFTPQGLAVTAIGAGAVLGADAYSAWRDESVAAGYCGEFTSRSKSEKSGCSLVQGLPYNVADIRNLCGTIEGNI